jgi:hypothetical protein
LRHSLGAAFEAILILAIIAALAFAYAFASGSPAGGDSAFAAKGGKGNGGGNHRSSATCSVTPSEVALGDPFTAVATALPANAEVIVKVSGDGGANFFMRRTTDAGAASVEWYATWTGTNTVGYYTNDGRMDLLGDCTFAVS